MNRYRWSANKTGSIYEDAIREDAEMMKTSQNIQSSKNYELFEWTLNFQLIVASNSHI